MVAFSLLLVFASEYEVFKLSIWLFLNFATVLFLRWGIWSLWCWATGKAWRRAGRESWPREGCEPAVLWGMLPGLPLMGTGACEGQCSMAGPCWKHQVCVWQVAQSGLEAGINHKGSEDGCSLGCYHGVSENRAAECKSLDLVYRQSPRETGWQQQAAAIGLCPRSFALAQLWVPLAMGQLFVHWVPVNVGATEVISSVHTRLVLLQHVKTQLVMAAYYSQLPLCHRGMHAAKDNSYHPTHLCLGCSINACFCLHFSPLEPCVFLKKMTAHEFRKQNSRKPLSMYIEGALVKQPELMISRNVWIFFVYKCFIIGLTCLP